MTDADIGRIVRDTKTIALVGMSPREDRPSWGVARYLQSQGYRVIPVNPGQAGKQLLGETVYADLDAIPVDIRVDMVDIFRRPDAVPAIVDRVLAARPEVKVIWMQIGVVNDAAAEKARAHGLTVVQDRCPKVEFPRHLASA